MLGELFSNGEILVILYFLGVLYIGIRSVMNYFKNFNTFLPSLFENKSMLYHIDINEIDKMEGNVFRK